MALSGAPSPPSPDVSATASALQPVVAGALAALVGFASTFSIILAGFTAVGASPAQAASGLLSICIMQGALGIGLSMATRMPISIVWSTPGAALLLATGTQPGGYATATGAVVTAGLLIALAGLWRPFGRLVQSIPTSLANAMLAGVLFEICLAPVTAFRQSPLLMLPIVLVWIVSLRFARRYAVPLSVACTAIVIAFATRMPAGSSIAAWPALVPTWPAFRWSAIGSLALPLFIVTMASQNIPGLAVLRANGYRPDLRSIFVTTGLGGAAGAFGSGGLINLAAITAALCAAPEAHPDPARRYLSSVAAGVLYIFLGLGAATAAAFIAASPPALIQAVAGLALMGTFGNALVTALDRESDRLAAVITFTIVASGTSFLNVGAAFWGLLAGGALLLAERRRR